MILSSVRNEGKGDLLVCITISQSGRRTPVCPCRDMDVGFGDGLAGCVIVRCVSALSVCL